MIAYDLKIDMQVQRMIESLNLSGKATKNALAVGIEKGLMVFWAKATTTAPRGKLGLLARNTITPLPLYETVDVITGKVVAQGSQADVVTFLDNAGEGSHFSTLPRLDNATYGYSLSEWIEWRFEPPTIQEMYALTRVIRRNILSRGLKRPFFTEAARDTEAQVNAIIVSELEKVK